jgi:phosphoribosylamine--glycine ligase
MKVLIVGGGGREHTLLNQYKKSPKVKKLYSVPGNGLMGFRSEKPVKTYEDLKPTDKKSIWEIVKREKIDLVDVSQDNPLAEGMVDFLESKGVVAFGPTKRAAEIEWNKDWSRNFMKNHGLPIPLFAVFASANKAREYIKKLPEGSFFVKASGLAYGKGAIKAESKKEAIALVDRMKEFGESGETFLVEECLIGEEVSIYALSDGKNFKILKAAQDNKPTYNFDEGPNSAGMGANAPALIAADLGLSHKIKDIVKRTIKGMKDIGRPYVGVLYLGLIIDKKKNLKIIEFNARWGDPEAQVVLPGIRNDYVDVVESCIKGRLGKLKISEDAKTRVCVVGASKGYPGDYAQVKGKRVFGIEKAMEVSGVTVYGAGLRRSGKKFTAFGGRVLNVVGEGKDVFEARAKAYQAISLITVEDNNMHYRTDIGWRDVERKVASA